jgi:hypothetical protein
MVLLLIVSIPFLRKERTPAATKSQISYAYSGLKKLRPVGENEVIAEFLKSEFYQEEFSRYREEFSELVESPDLRNDHENTLRRALLFHRRGRLWRELPEDTEWWEVELSPTEIRRVRVFARNQWLKYATPGFLLRDMADKIRQRIASHSRDSFIEKLRALSVEMTQNTQYSSVILITVNESSPLTILEGNHRMTAATMVSPEMVHGRFRFLCGFSPRMSECCWYRTDLSTLWRYALNTIAYYVIDRRKLITEVLEGKAASSRSGVNAA